MKLLTSLAAVTSLKGRTRKPRVPLPPPAARGDSDAAGAAVSVGIDTGSDVINHPRREGKRAAFPGPRPRGSPY